jgi:hypothetical protein
MSLEKILCGFLVMAEISVFGMIAGVAVLLLISFTFPFILPNLYLPLSVISFTMVNGYYTTRKTVFRVGQKRTLKGQKLTLKAI